METINKIKRQSRFKKEFSYYLRHPQYDELKKLYINGSFNNIKSVKNQFEKKIRKNNKSPLQTIEKIKSKTKKMKKQKNKIIKEIVKSYNVQIDRNLNARLKVEILNIYTNEKTLFQTDQLDIIVKNFKILHREVPKNYNFGIALRGVMVDEESFEERPTSTLFKSYISNNLDDAINKMINSERIKATSGYYHYINQYQLFYEVNQGGNYKKISYDDIKGCSIFSPISKKSCGHYCLKYFNIDAQKGFLSLSDVKALSPVEVSDVVLDCDEYILLRDGHFVVVIKDDVIRKRKEIKKIEKYENKKIKHLDELYNKKVCVYDIEAFGKMQTALAIGYTFDGVDFNYYYGPTCVEEFIKSLDCDYLIGFNSNKYDNILLRNEILKNGYLIEDITRSENNIIKTIISKKDKKIEFVDILNFTTGTLKKNLSNFKCSISKGEIDFDKLNFDMNENDKELMIEYLKKDVLGTFELYKKLDEPFRAFNVSILELYTLSQGAYKIIKEQWKEIGILQERTNRDKDAFFRKAIYGGRCEVFKRHFMSSEYKDIRMGKIKYDDISDYLLAPDVNSLYPYVMRNNKYPIGEAIMTTREIKEKMGIYKCDIKKPKNLLYPVLCSDGGFNLIDGQDVYTSFEIDEARKRGYIINVISGYYWNESKEIFKEYIDKFYEIKKNSEKSSPQYANSKLMMNAIYGKTIQRDKNIINYTVSDAEEMVKMKMGKDIKKFTGIFIDDIGYFEYEEKIREMTDKKPHIGAFILSYSKKVLNDIFSDVDPYYTDTDSIYIHAKHSNKLKWGNELGEFSNDVNGKIICAYFIAKKLKFMEVLTSDNKIEFIYTGKGCDTRTMTKNNFKKMYQGLEVENITTLNFKRGVRGGTIEKRHDLKKTIKMNDGKRTFLDDGSSIPYGYKL
jgi:hypothetical protein